MLLLSLLATLATSLPLVSASVFLEEGADLLYSASVLQTAASLDHSAAAAALAWRFTLRMQVRRRRTELRTKKMQVAMFRLTVTTSTCKYPT